MHRAIAEKLRDKPELLGIARDNLKRWRPTAGRSTPHIDAWEKFLDKPLDELLALIVEDSEHMRAMRQTGPFAGILSPKERWMIYDSFAVGAHHRGSGNDR